MWLQEGLTVSFFHNKINLWDVAAGVLLVSEAGGIVNDINQFDMKNINIRASSSAISNIMLNSLIKF